MKSYKEFEEALQEVAESAKEEVGFEGRFIMMIKNFMNGMEDISNINDLIEETIVLGEENED